MGDEEAVTGFPSPMLSSDSPALRRGEEVRKSRSFERFPPPGPEPLFLFFFLLKCGSDAIGASSFSPCFLNSDKSFGSTLRGFDAEEEKHPIASRAGKFGQKQVIFIAGHWSKHLVSAGLHLRYIYF